SDLTQCLSDLLFDNCDGQMFSLESEANDLPFDNCDSQMFSLESKTNLTFDSWEDEDNFMESYGKNNSYKCSHSQVHKAKKVVDITKQHDSYSTAIKCEWLVNFNNQKDTTQIVCTSFENKHNHVMNPIIIQMAPRFRKLSREMLDDIEFYTHSAKGMSAKMQYNLLKVKYPDNDAAETLKKLIELKADDSEWVVVPNIKGEGNSLFEVDFERCWAQFVQFLNLFPKASWYVLETLYSTYQSWAVCYTQTRFTAGIQSTQRVERMPHIANRYFLAIDSLLQEYLTPHIISLQRQQLSESFLYDATEMSYDWDTLPL
ncbi:18025_t:CDS:2, partial [Racocetra persica]